MLGGLHPWNVHFVSPWRLAGDRVVSAAGSHWPAKECPLLQGQSILCCVCSWAQFSFAWLCSNAAPAFGSEGSRNLQTEGAFLEPLTLPTPPSAALPAQHCVSFTELTAVQLLPRNPLADLALGLHSNNCLLCFLDSSRGISWGKQQV